MRKSLYVVLSLAVIAVSQAGCSGDAARAQRWDGRGSTLSGTANEHSLMPRPEHTHSPRREAHEEALLSLYNNPDEGLSLRYPRNYVLEEGEVQEHSYFLKTQEQLDLEEPGAELIVTLLIPEDAYPNTTFEHGSLQLWVGEADSSAGCRADSDDAQQASRNTFWTSERLQFSVAQEDSSVGGASLRQRRYAGFSGGKCFAFLATVAADESADADGFVKAADTGKVMKRLENIIRTFRLSSKP